jgi:hypothetical protein
MRYGKGHHASWQVMGGNKCDCHKNQKEKNGFLGIREPDDMAYCKSVSCGGFHFKEDGKWMPCVWCGIDPVELNEKENETVKTD